MGGSSGAVVDAARPDPGTHTLVATDTNDNDITSSGKLTATGIKSLTVTDANNDNNFITVSTPEDYTLPLGGDPEPTDPQTIYIPYTEDENENSTTKINLSAISHTGGWPDDENIPDWSTTIDGQTYPQPAWDGLDEVAALHMALGTHTIKAECGNTLSINVVARGVDMQEQGTRDSDDIQVQYYENEDGLFTYTAIPLQLYYRISPDTGWLPDNVTLEVRDLGGGLIRTISLPTNTGEQSTSWDGMSALGEHPEYGVDAYIATIIVTKGDKSWSTGKTFSIYEIRQGNCVYRPTVGGHEHAAILYEYTGSNSREDLESHDNYTVAEHPGSLIGAGDTAISNLGNYSDWISPIAWCPSVLKGANRRSLRKSILETCHNLVDLDIDYTPGDILNSTVTPWDGNISHIDELRCDGFVEFAYETNSIRLFGPDEWWDITASQGNLDEHNKVNGNDVWPERQRDSNATTNQPDALFLPGEL